MQTYHKTKQRQAASIADLSQTSAETFPPPTPAIKPPPKGRFLVCASINLLTEGSVIHGNGFKTLPEKRGRAVINLSDKQLVRYRQQLDVPGMTESAQARLLGGHVVILGNAGTGVVAAQALAQAGVGRITVVDDSPKLSARLGKLFDGASETDTRIELKAINPTDTRVEELLHQAHVAIDSLENWQDKLALSDMCMSTRTPLIHAGVAGFRYQLFSMLPAKSACLRCALPLAGIDDVPLSPLKVGKIDAVLEMVGSWQAIEAIKLIALVGATQGNELFKFDCLSGEFEIIRGLDPRHDCPDCGRKNRRPSA